MVTNLFDAGARVCAIHPVQLIGDPENPPEWVDHLAERWDGAAAHVFAELPELKNIDPEQFDTDREHALAVADALFLAQRSGFIVHVEIQVRHYRTDTTFLAGWRNYWLVYFYVPTIEAVLPATLASANRLHEKALADWRAEAGAA